MSANSLTKKQIKALDYLTDNKTKFIGYGGAAGGGKSWIGCVWLALMCESLPNSKWFIGRDSLKDTRASVLFTFRKVARAYNITGWRYVDNHIIFECGSVIEFIDLSWYPQKDPMFERLGSKEYTGGWIEEGSTVKKLAYEVLKSRINRWYNSEYGIVGKILVTFNPRKNWVDKTFYRPFKGNKQEKDTRFIYALAKDNPHLPNEYIETLENIKDKPTRERLLNGNFDYDDDPTSLLSYDSIKSIWNNDHIERNLKDKCITADIARFGSDKAIIIVWYGLVIVDYVKIDISKTTELQNVINALRAKHGIRAIDCIADEDGVGGGVVDNCRITGFINNGSAYDDAYNKIKDECGYKLAEMIDEIYFEVDVSDEDKDEIEEELAQLKTYQSDKDGKLRILPKEKIKENIRRSPDWMDNFIMRMSKYIIPQSRGIRRRN